MSSLDLAFWPAPVRFHDFKGHVAAAAAGGFTSLAIAPTTYFSTVEDGMSASDMKRYARDHGVPLRHLDTLTTWAPMNLLSDDVDVEMRERWSMSIDRCFEACEALELQTILSCAAYEKDSVPHQQLVDGFAALCERAAALSIWVDLEPMPFFGCPDVPSAWAIVKDAGQGNSGILMDTWHFYKGDPDLGYLDDIPGRFFRTMQISDAPARQIERSLFQDTIRHRQFPLEGELPVLDFVRAVAAKGHLTTVGQEVFSDLLDRLPVEEVGRRAGSTTREALRAAGVALPAS